MQKIPKYSTFETSVGDTLTRKLKGGICIAHGCGRPGEKHNKRKKRNLLCTKHRHLEQTTKHPCRTAYRKLKSNAKRREKEFTITYEYFEEWCNRTGYLKHKGRGKGYATIDREDDSKGYVPGNLKIMEHSCNCRKQFIDKWLDRKYGTTTHQEDYEESDINDKYEWLEEHKPTEDLPF